MLQVKTLRGATFADWLGCASLKGSNIIGGDKLSPKCLNLGKPPVMPICELPHGISDHFKTQY